MSTISSSLETVRFIASDWNLESLAQRLTELKALASRTPTPVTVEQLEIIGGSELSVLLLQVEHGTQSVVGMVHLMVNFLEDRAHLGPICIDKESQPRGHGTALMESAIEYIKINFSGLRRLDLSNRPNHDLAAWYSKFGFVERTEASGDPTTMYRLLLK